MLIAVRDICSQEGFARLKDGAVDCIETVTDTVTNHLLTRESNSIDKYILLDHMDWMGSAYPESLQEEWREIFRTATAKSQILFRSGSHQPGFLDRTQPLNDDKAETKAQRLTDI